jgi:hypothetical protein
MVMNEPQAGDRTIGPFQLAAPAPTAGTCRHRSQSASVCNSCFVVPADVSRAQPTPVIMKRRDCLPTRVLDGAPGRQQLGGAATEPASSNRRKYSP